ncbi:hypothetical protein MASR2M78_34170 [Treponema sp.]
MSSIFSNTNHHFHIPVLGTGFSIDTPLKVAPLGINSVISLVDDDLIEKARSYHAEREGKPFIAIAKNERDYRARRIQAYLDLLDILVEERFQAALASFPDGEASRSYFDLLPPGTLREEYARFGALASGSEKAALGASLKAAMRKGNIDVNIMTKLDRSPPGVPETEHGTDASSVLRGYAQSTVDSTLVLSAGMNPRLFDYMTKFDAFTLDALGKARKRIAIKVSDYRSAFIQGLQLARKGLWTSEFRVESGLNCGGHAFATKGSLLGPILEEFKAKRTELTDKLRSAFHDACAALGRPSPISPEFMLSVQGGVGTHAEHELLRHKYGAESVGWGSTFLLVPEATNVDEASLTLLEKSADEDIVLSDASPLGVPFWILRDSASEIRREKLIAEGKPGTGCPKGFLAMNEEFGSKPLCTASAAYLKKKTVDIEAKQEAGILTPSAAALLMQSVLAKACLCRDLASSFLTRVSLEKNGTTEVTVGPGIAYFKSRTSLSDMVSHIYGRLDLLGESKRPHFFVREAALYVDYLKAELGGAADDLAKKGKKYFEDFQRNLLSGLAYYEEISAEIVEAERERFLAALDQLAVEAKALLNSMALVAV